MSKKYTTAVVIGRFQPFHVGHLSLIKGALKIADSVCVIVGSANLPRTYKNPFSFFERKRMIYYALPFEDRKRVAIEPAENIPYNDQEWVAAIREKVSHYDESGKIVLYGHEKDDSSYYLKMFAPWDFMSHNNVEVLDATKIREMYFNPKNTIEFLRGVCPDSTLQFLEAFRKLSDYEMIVKEKEFIEKYRSQYANLPYEPVFVTVDAVVICSGNVLIGKRNAYPGYGLYALPGGFLDAKKDKSIEDAMLRELKEETSIDIPLKVLRGSIKACRVFDSIDRSSRGRTITHAYKIVLDNGEWNLPKLKAADDLDCPEWFPINKLNPSMFFEDHHAIITTMLGM